MSLSRSRIHLTPLSFLFVLLLYPVHAYTAVWDSGSATEELNLAVKDFMFNGWGRFSSATIKTAPKRACPGAKQNGTQAALDALYQAKGDLYNQAIFKGFGLIGVDAVGKAISMHPGGKALGTGIGLLKTWAESDSAADFAGKVVSDKAKGKLGSTAGKLGNSQTKKMAENLYGEIEKSLKSQKPFKNSIPLKAACEGGTASATVVLSFSTLKVDIEIKGSCNCGTGIKSYSASLKGKIIPTVSNGIVKYKLLGKGMKVSGECCKEKKPVELYMGDYPGRGTKIAIGDRHTAINQIVNEEDCKKVSCKKAVKLIEETGDRADSLKKKWKELEKADEFDPLIDYLREDFDGEARNLESICRSFFKCCNKKGTSSVISKKARKYISKYCMNVRVGMALPPAAGNTAIPASYTPNFLIATDSPKWCSFREGNPETSTPGDGDDPRDAPPPEDGGDDPRDAGSPGEGTPPGDDPRDVPGGGDDGDDPRDAPAPSDDGDDPRDVPGGGDDDDDDPRDADREDGDDPRDAPVTIYVKAKASAVSAGSTAQATAGQKIKLFADSTTNVALPGNGAAKPQTDHNEEPIQGTTDSKGQLALTVPASAIGAKPAAGGQSFEVSVDTTAQTSLVATPKASLPADLNKYVSDSVNVDGQQFTVLTLPKSREKTVIATLDSAGIQWETNYCREKQAAANDPLFKGKGAWKQKYDNQWAIKRVGLTNDGKTAWKKLGNSPKPVIIAVVDTGLDWNHLDIDWKNLWRNPKEVPNNGKDDDRNGYIDDVIGWDFYGRHNKPWDHDGHGTIVAGIIAATHNNKIGMAGINPHARIMVLKALNSFGHSRASYLAKAITYAVDNGARIINMSVGGKEITSIEKQAVKYAISKGVLIVVASGNEGVDVKNYGIAGLDGVLSVGATDLKDKRAGFSNWGAQIDLAAPGIDVLSLRARRTDTMRDIPGVEYKDGANYVGKDKRYYRASGTSFAAPIVAGVASLVMSKHPELSGEEVAQILRQTADDVDTPGVDQYSGHGIVNANKALEAEAGLFISANIAGVQVAQGKKGPIVQVMGTADADQFKKATIAIGAGEEPGKWKNVVKVKGAVKDGLLGEIDANELRSSTLWIIRLTVEHKNGKTQEFRFRLSLG